MPTYTYQCKTCEATIDVFHAMSAQPKVKCPECGKACTRLVGMGSGIIFKGSGFYETDYKKDGKAGTHKGKETKTENGSSAAKTESKSESKTESKSEKPAATTAASPASGNGTAKGSSNS